MYSRIFLLVLLISTTYCLVPNEFCFNSRGICGKKHQHKCDNDVCATKRELCQQFSTLADLIKCPLCKFMKSRTYTTEISKLISFVKSIESCPVENVWKPDDVCVKDSRCTKISNNSFLFKKLDVLVEKVNCKCKGDLHYYCGSNFCTNSKSVCDELKENMTKNLAASLTRCQFNKITKKKFLPEK